MPTLLTLPRELRDQICKYFILSQNELPALDASFQQLIESRVSYNLPQLGAWTDPGIVLYSPDNNVVNSTNLLLVNHQIHAETLENLKTVAEAKIYDLDLIILDEILVLPTWICVPQLTTSVDQVNATFRISGFYRQTLRDSKRFCIKEYEPYGFYRGFQGGDGAGPALAWQIFSVLERFFKVGPTAEPKKYERSKHITIKTLNINVETPPSIDPERFGGPSSSMFRRSEFKDETVLDPQFLANFIIGHINYLLCCDIETYKYGAHLYQHLNEIVAQKDGEELIRYDLAERLPKLVYCESSRWSKEVFENWRKDTVEERKARNLRVVEETGDTVSVSN